MILKCQEAGDFRLCNGVALARQKSEDFCLW